MYIANYKYFSKSAHVVRAIKADTIEKLIEAIEIMFPRWYVEENITIYQESIID